MRIASISCDTYRLPLQEAWVSAKYRITHHELVVTRVQTECGLEGTGWCTTIGAGGLAISALVQSYLAPILVGEDPRDVERLWEAMWQDLHFAGPGGSSTQAISTIDIALWDIRGRATRMPLWRLLGGAKSRTGVYASAVNLHLSQDDLLAQVERQIGQGFDVFKIKIGHANPEEDLERLRAVRKAIGSRTLLIDSNQRWQPADAVRHVRLLEEVRPGWIEEPCLSDDVAGHARLRQAIRTPVAIGEQLCNRYEFWNYVRENAADILQPNPGKVGGITEWMKIAHMAQIANLMVASHNSLEISAHLVCAIPNGYFVENIEGGNLADFGIQIRGPKVENATITLGEEPGHGVVLDHDRLANYLVTPGTSIARQSSIHEGL